MKARLLNKGEKFCTVIYEGKKLNVKTEEFEGIFNHISGDIYEMKKDQEAKIDKALELVNQAVVASMMAHETATAERKLVGAMTVSKISEEYCELLHCSLGDFMSHFNAVRTNFMKGAIKEGIGFMEDSHRIPENLKKKNKENIEKVDAGDRMSIGEMIKNKGKNI